MELSVAAALLGGSAESGAHFEEPIISDLDKTNYTYDNNTCVYMNDSNGYVNRTDDRYLWMPNPEEMLNPESRNPFFVHIVITHSITFIIGILGNAVAISVMIGEGKTRNATNLFLVR